MKNEDVLVFKRSLLEEIGYFQGLNFSYQKYLERIFLPSSCFFYPRDKAEKDNSLKQLISYMLITCEGKVLRYIRGKVSGETRLIQKASIGIGGHINQKDDTLFNERNTIESIYNLALKRELNEEIVIKSKYSIKAIAILNDDTDDVGKVHFGVIHKVELEKPNVEKNMSEFNKITQLSFLPPDEIFNDEDIKLENWSKICLENSERIFL